MPGSYKNPHFLHYPWGQRNTKSIFNSSCYIGQVLDYINVIQLRSLHQDQSLCFKNLFLLQKSPHLLMRSLRNQVKQSAEVKCSLCIRTTSNSLAFVHYYQPISFSPWEAEVCPLSLHFNSLHIILQQTFKFSINPQETFFFFLPVDPFA